MTIALWFLPHVKSARVKKEGVLSECLVLLGLPVMTTKNLKCDMLVLVIFKTAILLRCCSGASNFQISVLTTLHSNCVRGRCIILELFGCFGFSNVRVLGILILQ